MKNLAQKTVMTTSFMGLSTLAMAHPNHPLASSTTLVDAVTAGLMHPISGLDHIVLAAGMGMLFASHKKVGLGLLVTGLLVGFMSVQWLPIALGSAVIESAILLSVILTALAVLAQRTKVVTAYQKNFSVLIAISLFGLTLFHGMAHALEMPVGSITAGFVIGMMTAMSALFAAGAALVSWVNHHTQRRVVAWVPSVLAAIGATLVMLNA